jgi:uncharacterized protein YndB with AHSA1/START domain
MTDGANEYGIRISRVFDAPRERVWREWTEPERFADWYGGPQCEVPLDSVSMDVRPGGKWQLTMFAPPDRRRIDWKGEYLEVAAPERLVFTVSDQPSDDAFELVTVVLTPPRRQTDRDALRAARVDVTRAVRTRDRGLGRLLRPDGGAARHRLNEPGARHSRHRLPTDVPPTTRAAIRTTSPLRTLNRVRARRLRIPSAL